MKPSLPCEKVIPDSASQYGAKLAGLTAGLSIDELLEDGRNSGKYREAMERQCDAGKASPATGIRGCSELLAEK